MDYKIDIDGDGRGDTVKCDPLREILSINNKSIDAAGGYWFSDFKIVDIDNKDKKKEICVSYDDPSDIRVNLFYSYDSNLIYSLSGANGTPFIDGGGKVVFKYVRSQFFHTHTCDFTYEYHKDNSLRIIWNDLYEQKKLGEDGSLSYRTIRVKKELKTYKEKNSSELAVVLREGENVRLIGTDEKNWVLVENSQGIRGWFRVRQSHIVDELNLHSGDVFEGLSFAG